MAQEKCWVMLWSSDNNKKKVAAEANKLRSCDKIISCWIKPLCRAEGMKLLDLYIEHFGGCVRYSIIMDVSWRVRKGISLSMPSLGYMGLFPLPYIPREEEKGKRCCHVVHAPCRSPAPYHCFQITSTLEKTWVQTYYLACPFLLPILTSGNKLVTKKESGGDTSRLPLSITRAFGSLHLSCSLPHPSASSVWDLWSNWCCVSGVLLKELRWALFCLGTSGHWPAQTIADALCSREEQLPFSPKALAVVREGVNLTHVL